MSDFEKGQEKFAAGEYEEARQFFKKIKQTDSDFVMASERLTEIDSIFADRVYDLAIQRFSEGSYEDSKVLFLKIDSPNHNYTNAQQYLLSIDSVGDAQKLEFTKRDKAEEEKIDMELANAKNQIRALLDELISFKDDINFRKNGFSVGSKYNLWLNKVQELKGSQTERLLMNSGFVPGDSLPRRVSRLEDSAFRSRILSPEYDSS